MSTQQPESLRLAHVFDHPIPPDWSDMVAAASELRRLYAENETLQAGYDAARLEIDHLRGAAKMVAPAAGERLGGLRDQFELAYATAWAAERKGDETPQELAVSIRTWRDGDTYHDDLPRLRFGWEAYQWAAFAAAPATQPAPAAQGDALDAARYRWLRQPHIAAGQGSIFVELDDRANGHFRRSIFLAELDALIDAARAQVKEGGS